MTVFERSDYTYGPDDDAFVLTHTIGREELATVLQMLDSLNMSDPSHGETALDTQFGCRRWSGISGDVYWNLTGGEYSGSESIDSAICFDHDTIRLMHALATAETSGNVELHGIWNRTTNVYTATVRGAKRTLDLGALHWVDLELLEEFWCFVAVTVRLGDLTDALFTSLSGSAPDQAAGLRLSPDGLKVTRSDRSEVHVQPVGEVSSEAGFENVEVTVDFRLLPEFLRTVPTLPHELANVYLDARPGGAVQIASDRWNVHVNSRRKVMPLTFVFGFAAEFSDDQED